MNFVWKKYDDDLLRGGWTTAGSHQLAVTAVGDDAAGALIAQEAGVCYTDFRGRDVFPLRADSRVLAREAIHSIAALPTIHRELLAMLAVARSEEGEAEREETAH